MPVDIPRAAETFRTRMLETPQFELRGGMRRYRRGGSYTGAFFEAMVGAGDSPDTFSIVDIVALWTLSVEPRASMIEEILRDVNPVIEPTLAVWPDRDLAELSTDEVVVLNGAGPGGNALQVGSGPGLLPVWQALRAVKGMGPTRTSKLLAKKRPKLIPIYDSVVAKVLGLEDSTDHWLVMHALLRAEHGALHRMLQELGESAEGQGLSALRIFDILAWMYGKGHLNLSELPS